jgi:hypothetical protein
MMASCFRQAVSPRFTPSDIQAEQSEQVWITGSDHSFSQLMNLAQHHIQRLKAQCEIERSQFNGGGMPISCSTIPARLLQVLQRGLRVSLVEKTLT